MRYPLIRQHDATDCGPAVLAMIAAFYGKRQSIARLREIAGTDRRGTNIAGLAAAAEQIGFTARPVRAASEALGQVMLPAIAHWREENRNHFVVLYKASKKRVIIGDPAVGIRTFTPDDFHKYWSGILVLLIPSIRLRDTVCSKSSLSRLLELLLPHQRLFLDALLAAVLMTILGLTSSFFIQVLVDYVFVLGRTPALNWLGLGMLLVLLARVSFLGLRSCLLAHLSRRIDADMVMGYHRHLLGLPLSFFVARRTGEILSRMNDAFKIRIAVSGTTLSVLVDTLLVVTTIAIMLFLNPDLAMFSLSLVPVLGAVLWLLNRPLKRLQRTAMEKGAEVEARIVEMIGAIHAIKAFRAEPRIQARIESSFSEMLDTVFYSQMLAVHTGTISTMVAGFSTLGLLWSGGHQVLSGTLTIGRLMAMHALLGMVLGPIERLAGANQSIQDAIIAANRLGEVLELDSEIHRQLPNAIDRQLEGVIEFRNVTFRYGSREPVFQNVSLRVEAGECVGIIGESGSGKTTLVNLIARFFEPTSGQILIDGIDVGEYTFDCLRRQIVYVPQDIVLLNGSIADNIRLARPDATALDVRNAAQAVSLDHEAIVGERGLTLSGGERQRVAIARAILVNPVILVLDEPTAHLDAHFEASVQALIDSRRGRLTTIVISHRPLNVNRILSVKSVQSVAYAS